MRALCGVLVMFCAGGGAAQTGWSSITFHVEREAKAGASYSVRVSPDRLGSYWDGVAEFDPAQTVGRRQISVGADTVFKVGEVLAAVSIGNCETREKNIAQTGKKTLVVTLGSGKTSCTFNYSDDARVNAAVDAFEAIAETIHEGDKLQHDLRFDRLGLDAEMDFLAGEVKAGRAIEVQNIAAVLKAIVGDDRVMERVRRKAGRMLDDAGN